MDDTANLEGIAQPSGCPLATICRDLLSREMPGDPYGRTVLALIGQRLIFDALRGNVRAARDIREVLDGAIPSRLRKRCCSQLGDQA